MPTHHSPNILDRVYLGTWQFADVDESTAIEMIVTSQETGINRFDTARVYARGRAEHLLGKYCSSDAVIVTKIPAVDKRAVSYHEAYPESYAIDQIDASLETLGRLPTAILLHNWQATWEGNDKSRTTWLRDYIYSLGVQHFGVSLPDRYNGQLETSASFALFDTIELPYNTLTPGIDADRIRKIIARNKTVLARSLLQHGRDKGYMAGKFNAALSTGASIVVGATSPDQIQEWKKEIQ